MIERVEGTTSYEYKQPIKGNAASNAPVRAGAANAAKKPEGVILDLSVNSAKPKTAATESRGQFSIWKSIRAFFLAIRTWLIDFWESGSETTTDVKEEERPEVVPVESVAADPDGGTSSEEEALQSREADQEAIVTDISNEDLELYTLLAEMSVGHIQLDDLDSTQVSRLLEIGMDLDAAENGTFDYAKLLEEWSKKLGLLGTDATASMDTGKQPEAMQKELSKDETGAPSLIQEAVQAGSLSRLEELITQNGTKKLAHNSDLLTYYDKTGQLVHLDDTQKHRVLYGDRHILKL